MITDKTKTDMDIPDAVDPAPDPVDDHSAVPESVLLVLGCTDDPWSQHLSQAPHRLTLGVRVGPLHLLHQPAFTIN